MQTTLHPTLSSPDDMPQPEFLRRQMERCRRLAASIGDRQVAQTLESLARDYEERIRSLSAAPVQ
jgi:hypothetical protein